VVCNGRSTDLSWLCTKKAPRVAKKCTVIFGQARWGILHRNAHVAFLANSHGCRASFLPSLAATEDVKRKRAKENFMVMDIVFPSM
jgi:hypothetical protein